MEIYTAVAPAFKTMDPGLLERRIGLISLIGLFALTLAPQPRQMSSFLVFQPVNFHLFSCLMDQFNAGQSTGASSVLRLNSFLQSLQPKKSSSVEPKDEQEDWKKNILETQGKKLTERWEQVSPAVKNTLQRYSPRKLKRWLSQDQSEHGSMADLSSDTTGQIYAERQSRYKQISDFYLNESQTLQQSSQKQSYLNETSSSLNPQVTSPPTQSAEEVEKNENCDRDANLMSSDNLIKMPVAPPFITVTPGSSPRRPMTLHPPPPDPTGAMKRKSPVTVQEWVDHLPVKSTPPSELREDSLIESAALLRCQVTSRLSREPSVQSSSSLDSLLDSRRPDPVEVLLNLGFGGVPGLDLDNCRIPKRFLVPSKCKGGDWDEFLRRELLQAQNFECSSLGFRGLSGPMHQRPSAIVANIMEKLREQTSPRPPPRITNINRFNAVAKRVLSETSVLSKLSNHVSSTSVLSPDNRKFLESQGKISPEVPRRRIIFGEKSFAISKDGELVEEDPKPVKHRPAASAGSWSGSAEADSDSEEGKREVQLTPEELLRMRRSSLQRQRRIEDDDEHDGPAVPLRFDAVGEEGEDLRDALVAEIETLTRRIQSAPAEELAAILRPIKELRGKLAEL